MPRPEFRTKFVVVGLVAIALLASAPARAFAQTDVTGVWEVTMTTPQGPNTMDVTFKQQGGAITGELNSPLGVAPFKGTIAGDTLIIAVPIDIQGMALELGFNVKVTGNTMAGTVKFGDLGEAPLEGKRKAGAAAPAAAPAAAAAAPAPAPVPARPAAPAAAAGGSITGDWNLVLTIQGADMPLVASLKQDGDKFSGTFTSDQGVIPLNGTVTGSSLKASFTAETPAGNLAVVMVGDLLPTGSLKGKMTIEGLGDADWVGTRK